MAKDCSAIGANDGPLSAVSAAFVENKAFIRKFLTRFFSNQQDIEDTVQEAYLRAYIAEQHKAIEQPKAFLFRIARNIAITELTKKSAQITDYIEDCGGSLVIEGGHAPDTEAEAQESLGIYCEAVARLSSKCREAYLLRKVHGLAHKEIAARMSLSVSSVEKYLLKGVLECKAYINEREGNGVRRAIRKSVAFQPQNMRP